MWNLGAFAQEPLSLEACYILAEKAYPLSRQSALLGEKSDYEQSEIRKTALPQLSLNGSATWQSEVIKIPLEMPGTNINPPNKDQYRATVDVEQLIYNGNSIAKRAALKEAELKAEQQQVEVTLYGLKNRVNQYFFNALLLQEQSDMLEAKQKQLEARLGELASAVKFGTVLPSEKNVLHAEFLMVHQEKIRVKKDKETALNQLSALISAEIDSAVRLLKPDISIIQAKGLQRPELRFYDLKSEELTQRQKLMGVENYPRLLGFAQAGYGNPGLNMLNNNFEDFYIVGARLRWRFFDWGRTRDKKQALEIAKEIMTTEKETFVLNNNTALQLAMNEIDKYRTLLQADRKIVALRQSIVSSSQSQLKNGVITASEFLTEFNKLYSARINQKLHQLQLELAKANYRIVQGYKE
ncbi:TolC family protein [Saccharicrinis carchari]|nr:TolC family protein [Saccharicrinis carchari]